MERALKAKSTQTGPAALGKGYTIEEALILAEFFLMWTLRASHERRAGGVALERQAHACGNDQVIRGFRGGTS